MDKKKIAVVYSSEAQKGIVNGIDALNCKVTSFFYGWSKNRLITKLFYKSKDARLRKIEEQFNNTILLLQKKNKEEEFDLIVFIKGHFLNKNALNVLKTIKAKKILWTIDSLERFPGQASLFPYVDKIYVQDGTDKNKAKNIQWLPLGFDDQLFKEAIDKEFDVLLVGNLALPFYRTRREYLLEASKLAIEGYKVAFAGSNLSKGDKDVMKKRGVLFLGRLPLKEYAEVISKSKVCINIHQDDGGKAINPLFFAIPAVGSLQVTEERNYFKQWLEPTISYFPLRKEELNENIKDLLKSGIRLSNEVVNKVREEHSYKGRAKIILT